MSMLVVAIVGVLTAALGAAESTSGSRGQQACAASPRQDWMPKVIAPSAGASPIWFVDGGGGVWHGADYPIKSVWILERTAAGPLRVTGRERQSNKLMSFRRGLEAAVTPSLLIEAPFTESMTPGGASAETMRKFAFVSSYVFYPSPGCWELDAQLGERRVTIVVDVRQQ